MKRILTSLVLIVCITSVLAEELVEWKDVAPQKWSGNIMYKENNTFYNKHHGLYTTSCLIGAITLVGIPFCSIAENKHIEIENNNYWYERKQEFEAQRNLCKMIKDNDKRAECYIELRRYEKNTTAQKEYNQEQLRAQSRQEAAIRQQTNTINNMNNNLNSIRFGY